MLRAVDGDTIEVRVRGRTVTVRLIGVDTPESVAPGQPVECYALAASRYTARRLEGERVRLELDVERVDRYGRTLAYVWLGDELFNETLVREGYAVVATYPPNVRYVDRFTAAQRAARQDGRGLWGRCDEGTEPAGGDACDPAYPGVCIPPPPPDLDCADVPYRRFTVRSPDPHGFDGDHDGIGCET
ncbi:Thermonuclease [bacterium HR12]|nr:Thermonuclease [bacterium HR12]